jgi:hypothetical protein
VLLNYNLRRVSALDTSFPHSIQILSEEKVLYHFPYPRLTKMHAKALTCFNFFNFHPVSTKFPINIEHVILTNRMFFVFQIATFLAGK